MTVIPDDCHQEISARMPYVRTSLPPDSFTLLSFCLMTNHFHLEIRQNYNLSIGELIKKVCTSYAKYFNQKYERPGHIFQDRFKAVQVTGDPQLLWLSAYIHNNPVEAGIVKQAEDYEWSSYSDYLGLRNSTLCDKNFILSHFKLPGEYQKFVETAAIKIKERKDLASLLVD